MFNVELKKEALRIHEETLARYNNSYEKMKNECENLYNVRGQAIKVIKMNQNVINSIANTPKEFDTTLGKIGKELTKFNDTEEYAKKAYNASVQAGINIAGGAAAGLGVASMAPTALMSIATTFGTASTGTAISTLSGCVAQKAALAWIGRTFAGFAAEGAGMAAGQAFLALAGPIGWGITAVSTGVSLISLSNKNKELADKAVNSLRAKTDILYTDMDKQRVKILKFLNTDYLSLEDEDKYFLGTLVNNTLSLSVLLNETVQ